MNFVTNFSEVSLELVNDFEAEVVAGNTKETMALAKDIKENLLKIAYHGNRADSIVKSMLQHSRKGTGQKQPTDINILVDYLRLSYQGLRAKDKDFNAKIKMELDDSIGNINIVPQDIGRVILNLFTNAFYSVNQKKKSPHPLKGGEEVYEPIVTVSTSLGISEKSMTKIFQPFFTTKPSGEGIGLGLSLSHEIITKGHEGTINVESRQDEFAEFIIHLPL